MNKRTLLVGLAVLLVALLLAALPTVAAGAQTSTSFDLSWYVLAGGGDRSAGTNYALNGTLGQWAVSYSDSTNYRVHSGYWQSWLDRRLYLPLVVKSFL